MRRSRQVKEVYLGPYPRGIAVDPDSRYAYVAVMGTSDVARVDLRSFAVSWIRGVGAGPRHLCMSPDGKYLYVTCNAAGTVVKVDLRTRRVTDRVATGVHPRSMALAPDGRSLYVVNYDSNTMSKVRTGDMKVLQVVADQLAADRRHLRPADEERVGLLLHRQHHGVQGTVIVPVPSIGYVFGKSSAERRSTKRAEVCEGSTTG